MTVEAKPREKKVLRSRVAAELHARRINKKTRTADVAFSSQAPIVDMFRFRPLVLLHEKDAVSFERLMTVGAVLMNHDADQVIGEAIQVDLGREDRVGRATIRFDDDSEGERVFRKVLSGSLKGVSVGFVVREIQVLEEDETWRSPEGQTFTGPVDIATRWEVLELSLTPIPADASVGVGRSLSTEVSPMGATAEKKKKENGPAISDEQLDLIVKRILPKLKTRSEEASAPPLPGEPPKDPDPEATKPENAPQDEDPTDEDETPVIKAQLEEDAVRSIKSESKRIRTLEEIALYSSVPREILDKWKRKGTDVEDARDYAEAFMRANGGPIVKPSAVEVGSEPRERVRHDYEAALLRRLAQNSRFGKLKYDEKACRNIPTDVTLFDIAAACVRATGVRTSSMTKLEIITRAAAHGTGDFTVILDSSINKTLNAGFTEARSTYQPWTSRDSVTDFKDRTRASLSEMADFRLTPELMPAEHTTISDQKATYRVSKYMTKFGISYEAIRNDDLSAISRIPQQIGQAGRRTINNLVYTELLSNPTVPDGKSLFDATHASGSNYISSGTVLNSDNLGIARKMMRLQKGIAGEAFLDVVPSILLVPPSLENVAQQLIAGEWMPTSATTAKLRWINSLEPVVEPRLEADSATAWYLIADPMSIDTLVVALLDGQESPRIQRVEHADTLGVSWIAFVGVGAKALEHRGFFKNDGA